VVSVRSTLVDGLHDIRVFMSGTFTEQRTGLEGYSLYPFENYIIMGAHSETP
jgi:hypothetical protein